MRFDFLPALPREDVISRPGFDRIAHMREATACSRAVVLPGCRPYAAPLDCINRNATHYEAYWLHPNRDGPRKLVEPGGVPYWRSLGSPMHQPIENRAQVRQVMGFWQTSLTSMAQMGVDALVGASAILRAVVLCLLCRPTEAKQVLADHILQLMMVLPALACVGGAILGARAA